LVHPFGCRRLFGRIQARLVNADPRRFSVEPGSEHPLGQGLVEHWAGLEQDLQFLLSVSSSTGSIGGSAGSL
jgi:hypothetical protein